MAPLPEDKDTAWDRDILGAGMSFMYIDAHPEWSPWKSTSIILPSIRDKLRPATNHQEALWKVSEPGRSVVGKVLRRYSSSQTQAHTVGPATDPAVQFTKNVSYYIFPMVSHKYTYGTLYRESCIVCPRLPRSDCHTGKTVSKVSCVGPWAPCRKYRDRCLSIEPFSTQNKTWLFLFFCIPWNVKLQPKCWLALSRSGTPTWRRRPFLSMNFLTRPFEDPGKFRRTSRLRCPPGRVETLTYITIVHNWVNAHADALTYINASCAGLASQPQPIILGSWTRACGVWL